MLLFEFPVGRLHVRSNFIRCICCRRTYVRSVLHLLDSPDRGSPVADAITRPWAKRIPPPAPSPRCQTQPTGTIGVNVDV